MIAGTSGIDAAMTYEPFLSAVRAKPEAGRILATTLDYPIIMDTFGCTPKVLAENPRAANALADAYFDGVAMIRRSLGRRRQTCPKRMGLAGCGFQPTGY
jgi:NitT/TauT family transport system substrate-binding protein